MPQSNALLRAHLYQLSHVHGHRCAAGHPGPPALILPHHGHSLEEPHGYRGPMASCQPPSLWAIVEALGESHSHLLTLPQLLASSTPTNYLSINSSALAPCGTGEFLWQQTRCSLLHYIQGISTAQQEGIIQPRLVGPPAHNDSPLCPILLVAALSDRPMKVGVLVDDRFSKYSSSSSLRSCVLKSFQASQTSVNIGFGPCPQSQIKTGHFRLHFEEVGDQELSWPRCFT